MFWLALTGLIVSVASTAYSVVSTIQQAEANADLQRQQAEVNAQALEAEAETEKQNQLAESLRQRKEATMMLAEAETGYAKSGVALEGTPAYSLAYSASNSEMETLMYESASEQTRQNLLVEAENTRILGESSASLTSATGTINAISNGLNGASSIATSASKL